MMRNRDRIIQFVWFAVIISLLVLSFRLLRSGELEAQVASFGLLAPLILIGLKATTLIIAPLGGSPLYIIAGALFGTVKGFTYTFIGDVIGSVTCFLLARAYGQKVVHFLVSDKYFDKVMGTASILEKGKSFLKARAALITIPELLAYAAGLSKIGFWTFVLIHTAFYVPVDLTFVLIGDTIAELSVKHLFFLYGTITLLTAGGFMLLYKDYESREELLRDEKMEGM